MLFNSFEYLFFFLPITVVVYFLLNRRRLTTAGSAWLVFASLFFYSWWNVKYLALILTSIIVNFSVGSQLARLAREHPGSGRRTAVLVFGVAFNLLLLGYYKYTDFFITNLNELAGFSFAVQKIVLPLGISFFTFTQIAYLVDASKGTAHEYDFLNYCLFVTFFPHLLAGPIIHHKEMMPQFARLRNKVLNHRNVALGLFLFCLGLFKKVHLADTLSPVSNAGFDTAASLTFIDAWVTSLSYTLQLYFDFSAYTDMALGASLLFNIRLPINFDSPYKALDIADFWRRWHMTLSRFLRDYIYIPLGGNRRGLTRTYLNLLATFLLGGLWHGAGWTFIFWGFLHGAATAVHRFWSTLGLRMPKVLAWLLTFNFVNIAWVFFRARTWADAMKVLKGMAGMTGVVLPETLARKLAFAKGLGVTFAAPYYSYINRNAGVTLLLLLAAALVLRNSNELVQTFRPTRRSMLVAGVAAVISVLSMTRVTEFLYFNF